MDNVLTLDFNQPVRASDLGGKTPFFRTGLKTTNPLDLMNHREETKRTENNIIKWLKFKGFKHNLSWDIVEKNMLNKKSEFDYTHSITLNKDMRKYTYGDFRERNELDVQMMQLLIIIDEFSSGIKKLILVYEYGEGKLHWHMCAKLKNARNFKKALQASFGTNEHAVWFKNIKANKGQTQLDLKENFLSYYSKEKHNEKECYMFK